MIIFLTAGCGKKIDSKQDNELEDVNEWIYTILHINMPLAFEDLDNYFEFPIMDALDESGVGEISGDGTPIGVDGPYATDIDINIKKRDLEKLGQILSTFNFPKGTYLEVDEQNNVYFGDLCGVKLSFNNLTKKQIETLYNSLKENIKDLYVYTTLINFNEMYRIYFYTSDLNTLKEKLNEDLTEQGVSQNAVLMDMPEFIQE